MANKIELLKTKVQESKNDFEVLKKTDKEQLENEKVQEKYEKIKEVKKELQSLKSDTLMSNDPEAQKELSQMENDLSNLEKEFLSQFDVQLSNLRQEVDKSQEVKKETPDTEEKWRLRRQRDWVTSKEEWKEHTLTNISRVAMWVWAVSLAWKWVKRLFGIWKYKKEEDKKENPEWEKKSRWKKALLRWGWIFGWLAVRNNRDKIKGRFWRGKEETPENPENPNNTDLPNSYNRLPEAEKQEYNSASDEVDTFTKGNIDLSTVVEFPEDDKVNKWNILLWLDNHSKNLQNFYTNDTLDYISWETTDGPIDNIMNRWKTKMREFLLPFLSGLESFKPLGTEFLSKPAETLDKRLKSWEQLEREKILSLFYREYMNIINYSVEKKKLLEEKLAKEQVMWKDKINQQPTEKEQDAIEDLLDSDERRKWKLDSFFKQHKLKDLPSLCKEYWIEASEVSSDTKEILESLQEEKDEILQKDDEWETVFSRAETDLSDGGLQEDTVEELDDTCENLLDIEFWDSSKSLFSAYTHLITDIFWDNKELADSFMEKTKLKELSEEFKSNLEWYRAKLKAWNFSPKDLQDLQTQTDSYLNAKKHYEISMKNIDHMSEWFNINRRKILTLPIDAAKDIWKWLWKWKTNSRRERVWYGLWWCYVTWQTLYLWSKLTPSWSMLQKWVKVVTYWLGRTWIEIWKLPVTLAEKWLKLLTWRTHLTSWARSRYIKNAAHLNKLEKTDLLKYAFLNGEMSDSSVMNVVKKLEIESVWWGRINTIDEILSKRWLSNPKEIELFRKYRSNKSLRNLLVKKETIDNLKLSDKFKYSIKDKILKLKVEFDTTNFTKLKAIESNIETMTATWTKERIFRETFMKNTKTLDKIDDLMKNRRLMWLLTEIWNTSDDYVKLSKILSSNFHTFSSVDELENYMLFLKNNKPAITNTNTFIRNSIWKRGKLKVMNSVDQAKYIETAKLNTSFLDRRINWMKENFKKSAETLKKLIKRSPYPQQVAETARNLENMANVENEVYRAAQMAEEVGEWTWLSGKAWLMNQISPLLKEKAFLESLGKAKTPQAIKELFASKWINNIPEELAQSISQTKNTRKIVDTINYVKNYDKLNGLMKVLQNPTMKYAWRVAGRVLWVWTVVLGWVFAYNTYQEWSEIKKTNTERWDIRQQESFYDLWLALAGACAFVPWVGRVAGAVIIWLTTIWSIVKESIFDTLDKYNGNYKDFLQDSPLLIKQHILTTILWQGKTDAAMWEYLARRFSSKDFEHLTKKTWSEAMKALLYVEEWKNNPLAMYDINNPEMMGELAKMNPPISRQDVANAVEDVENRVTKRYEYLKQKLGTIKWKDSKVIWIPIPGTLWFVPSKVEYEDGKSYLDVQKTLTSDIVSKWNWMESIDKLLLESSYSSDSPELFDSAEKIESQKKELKEKLDSDSSTFTKLEKLYSTDQKSLLYMYRYSNDYKNHMETFGVQDDRYQEINKNIDYFSGYMNYKSLETWLDIPKNSQWFTDPDFILCREFFVNFESKSNLSSKEIYWEIKKLQNILYRIATEVIWAHVSSNSMEEIKSIFTEDNEKTYGLYFDDWDIKKLSINGSLIDSEFDSSNDSSIPKIKEIIQKKIEWSDLIDVGTWDKILNKEIWSKYIKIIDEELARK